MRVYTVQKEKKPEVIQCNCCGKRILIENGIVREGVFSADCTWGYFSKKDGELHSFDLCEDCYDKIVKTFRIPPKQIQSNEMI